MSEFLLLGARSAGAAEMSPRRVAHDMAALTAWHDHLCRWGLLRSFALPHDSALGLRVCLIVRASGHVAANRLADDWGRRSGYLVIVLQLCDAAAGEGMAA